MLLEEVGELPRIRLRWLLEAQPGFRSSLPRSHRMANGAVRRRGRLEYDEQSARQSTVDHLGPDYPDKKNSAGRVRKIANLPE